MQAAGCPAATAPQCTAVWRRAAQRRFALQCSASLSVPLESAASCDSLLVCLQRCATTGVGEDASALVLALCASSGQEKHYAAAARTLVTSQTAAERRLQLTPVATRALVRALLASEQRSAALSLFRDQQAACEQPQLTATFTDLISGLARPPQLASRSGSAGPAAALTLWREVRASGNRLDAAVFCAGASAHAATGQLGEARRLLEEMRSLGISPKVRMFNVLLAAAGRAGDIGALDGVLDEMRSADVQPNGATHGALVAALVRCGELGRAVETLSAARSMNPPPDVQAYTALVQAYARKGDFERSRALMVDMHSAGVPPNAYTHTVLLDGLVRAGRLDEAREVLESIDANAASYNAVLRGYASAGRTQDALALRESMSDRGVKPNLVTFNTLLRACVDDPKACTQLLAAMTAAGLSPDVATTTTLITAASRGGDVSLARTLFASVPASDRDAPLYNAMLATLAFANLAAEAAELLSLMRATGTKPTVVSHGAVVSGLMRSGNLDGALAAYDAACAEGIRPDVRMFDILIDGCLRADRMDTLLRLCGEAQEQGVPLKTTIASALQQAKAKDERGFSVGAERLKWFLGIRSRYYEP